MADCFISYSSKDEEFAKLVHRDLAAHALNVFMAAVTLKPGDRWSERILAELRESPWVLFLASKAACASPYVQQEVGSAAVAGKKLVPVVWDQSPSALPGWANQHQALDIRDSTPAEIQLRIVEIAQRIRADKLRGLMIGAALIGGLFYLAGKSD
jgi:hypothetical protein